MVEGLVADVLTELGSNASIFLTGGHAPAVANILRLEVESIPDLTLFGLRLLYWRNAAVV
jgi:pantothenate kinase type III